MRWARTTEIANELLSGRVMYANPLLALLGLFGLMAAAGGGGGGGGGSAGAPAAPAPTPTSGGGSTPSAPSTSTAPPPAPAASNTPPPSSSDPVPSDPAPSDPVPSDPAPTDPAPADPAPSDPAPSDPAPADPPPSNPTPPASPADADLLADDPVEETDTPETAGAAAPPPAPVAAATASSAPDLPDSAFAIGWGGLTAEEQMIVELVNRARLDPQEEIRLQNEGIAPGGNTTPQEALAVVPTLSNAARDHSQDMDNQDFFAHRNLAGDDPWDRARDAGHENGFVGENIGWIGSTGGVGNAQARATAHQANLWESDGHQVNMLSGSWSEIGLGYDYGDYVYEGTNYTGSTFATQKFGDTGKTYLTGVVIDDADGDEFYDIGEGQGGVRITAWNDDGVFATATWASGGYSLALPSGTYTVAFEGGDLDGVYETTVTIGSENVKLDVIEDRDATPSLTNAATPDGAAASVTLSMAPPSGPDAELAAAHLLEDSPIPPLPEDDFGSDPASEMEDEAELA